MSLVSPTRGVIAANDDGGERRNSRIERYLPAGAYLIEAATYLERDYQPLRADFVLVVQLVDEEARQRSFRLKIEETYTPDRVVAGEPFPVHYRVGNLGGGDLAAVGGSAEVYVVGPRVYDYTFPIVASADRWQAGVSYHSGAQVANATSVAIGEVTPFEATFGRPGPSWVFVGVVTYDRFGQEVGFHGLWRNLMVLSGRTFGPVTVKVGGRRLPWSWPEADAERESGNRSQRCRRPGRGSRLVCSGEGDLRRGRAYSGAGRHLRAARRLPSCRSPREPAPVNCGESVFEHTAEGVRRPVRGRGCRVRSGRRAVRWRGNRPRAA